MRNLLSCASFLTLLLPSIASGQIEELEFTELDTAGDGCAGQYFFVDVSGDELLDVVSICSDLEGIRIATELAVETGGFANPVTSIISADEFDGPALGSAFGDFDDDGNLDIVASSLTGFGIFTGDGSGGFELAFEPGSTVFAFSPVAYDLDADGIDDFMLGTVEGVRIFFSDGRLDYDEGVLIDTVTDDFVVHMALSDFDGDGALDIIAGGTEAVSVLFTDGRGEVEETESYDLDGDDSTSASFLTVGDYDSDGSMDIAYVRDAEHIEIIFGDSDRVLPDPEEFFPTDDQLLVSLASGDLDGDGDRDLVAGNVGYATIGEPFFPGDSFTIFENDGPGEFEAVDFEFPDGGENCHQIFVQNLDADCDLDLVLVNNEFVTVGETPEGLEVGYWGPYRMVMLESDGDGCDENPAEPEFQRGDANGDGQVLALPDGLYILRWGFLDGAEPPCMDAADVDDDGDVSSIPDALFLFRWLFMEGAAPPDPGPSACGPDPDASDDELGCARPAKECP